MPAGRRGCRASGSLKRRRRQIRQITMSALAMAAAILTTPLGFLAPTGARLPVSQQQRTIAPHASLLDRRSAAQTLSLAAALLLSRESASALSDLSMSDLDIGDKPVAAAVGDLSAPDVGEPIAVGVVTLDANGKKPKRDTPASRLKELQARNDLSEKEKKELRRLKADEMCEMLGRGC